MSRKMDLPADGLVAWAKAANARYARRRAAYRRRHPDRTYLLDERAVYLAPVALRPKLSEAGG